MSSDLLKEIVVAGEILTAMECYSVGTTTLFFYDYLLTLKDEVKYVWSGEKSWVFVLFMLNRYSPMVYLIWELVTAGLPRLSQRTCDDTAFTPVLALTGCTLFAQTALTLRIYAISAKNRIVAACFGVITASQFTLGMYLTVTSALGGAEPNIPIPLMAFKLCFFKSRLSMEIAFTAIALLYDLLAFLFIISLALKAGTHRYGLPSLFKVIAEDATLYFMVIFTSHLILELTLIFGSPAIKLLPGIGIVVYLPLMVTRIMLSLKKAAATQGDQWSFGEPTAFTGMRFAGNRDHDAPGDAIALQTHQSKGSEGGMKFGAMSQMTMDSGSWGTSYGGNQTE